MSIVTGMHSDTIRRGSIEIEQSLVNRTVNRVRVVGGGRKGVEKKPFIEQHLLNLVQDETGGDPTSPKKWVKRTLRPLK